MVFNFDSHIDLIQLDNALKTFAYTTNLNVTLINHLGDSVLSEGKNLHFCKQFNLCLGEKSPCREAHLMASKQALDLGEPYIFFCPAGLIHISCALTFDSQFKGAFIAGPFLMVEPDELIIDDLYDKFSLPLNIKNHLANFLNELPIISTHHTRYFANLLQCVTSSVMLKHSYFLEQQHTRVLQQSLIGETIQYQKYVNNTDLSYPYEKERELLFAVRSGDIKTARATLNELLGHILFSHGGNIHLIKTRSLELCSLLSRSAVESGAKTEEVLGLNSQFLSELMATNQIPELSAVLQKILDQFSETVLQAKNFSNLTIIRSAVSYINENYSEDISLEDVAKHIHLNASYLSTLFKKEMGVPFSSFLNTTRIEHSKLLLANTNLSILEIALQVGFENQSYYCKVFKKLVGLTPKQYQNSKK